MVPAKNPPNVKLENFFITLECQSWSELCVPCFLKAWGFYSKVELTFVSWPRRYFLMEKHPYKCSISWYSSHIEVS